MATISCKSILRVGVGGVSEVLSRLAGTHLLAYPDWPAGQSRQVDSAADTRGPRPGDAGLVRLRPQRVSRPMAGLVQYAIHALARMPVDGHQQGLSLLLKGCGEIGVGLQRPLQTWRRDQLNHHVHVLAGGLRALRVCDELGEDDLAESRREHQQVKRGRGLAAHTTTPWPHPHPLGG
eukprot:scaffold3_cov389-Prasinococcus_capsulatus_cf.AAC.10